MKFNAICGAFLASIPFLSLLTACGSKSDDGDMNDIDYIAVQEEKDGNWSFYAPDGKILYPDEFKQKPTCVVEGYFSVKEGDGYTLYKAADKPEVVKDCEGLYDLGYMAEGLIPVTRPKERITVIKGNGEAAFTLEPVKGKEITSCAPAFAEGLLWVTDEDGKEGYVDTKGQVVIPLKYESARDFHEGLAVVTIKNSDDENEHLVIDKKGETVFKIRKGFELKKYFFRNGYLVAKDSNGRIVFLDTKGEIAYKAPAKVETVGEYNKNLFVFRNEDGEYGVMTFAGETLIRPKFEGIMLVGDKFLCNSDKEAVLLSASGDEEMSFDDFDRGVAYLGRFGYVGVDRQTSVFLDKEGKPLHNAEFNDISIDKSHSYNVSSDFFNTQAVVDAIVDKFTGKGLGKFVIGAHPSALFSSPDEYTYTSNVRLDEFDVKGYRFEIRFRASFTTYMAYSNYQFNGWEYNYVKSWNPESELNLLIAEISTQTKWGNDGSKAIVKAFRDKGFALKGETKESVSEYKALLTKGKVLVFVSSDKDSSNGAVFMANASDDNVRELTNAIKRANDEPEEVAEEVVEEAAPAEAAK